MWEQNGKRDLKCRATIYYINTRARITRNYSIIALRSSHGITCLLSPQFMPGQSKINWVRESAARANAAIINGYYTKFISKCHR